MEIGKKDVIWGFAGTFMRVASGIIVLPMALRLLSKEDFGLWQVFLGVSSIVGLLDFGFSNSFARNITYVFSGVKSFQKTGFTTVDSNDKSIDYNLLKSLIRAMQLFYGLLSLGFLLIFLIASPFYLNYILSQSIYSGNSTMVWTAWYIFGFLIAYQLYTFYYGSLMIGRGYQKRNSQITIFSQVVRILVILIMLYYNFGLTALVCGQLALDLIARFLSYNIFYDKDLKAELRNSVATNTLETIKIMAPNAMRIGVTTLGAFFINRSIILIAPLYLSLSEIGSYGFTKQMIDLIVSVGNLWFGTYYPKLTFHRVNNATDQLKRMYIKSKLYFLGIFLSGALGLLFVAPTLFGLLKAKTTLLPTALTTVFLLVSFLEANHGLAAQMLLTKNEVPFAKASILSGIATVAILYLGLQFSPLGIWFMILAPGIAQLCYQNWKWPYEVIKDLKLTISDYWNGVCTMLTGNKI